MFKKRKILREILAAGSIGIHEMDLWKRYRVGRVWMRRFCWKQHKRGILFSYDPKRGIYREYS